MFHFGYFVASLIGVIGMILLFSPIPLMFSNDKRLVIIGVVFAVIEICIAITINKIKSDTNKEQNNE